MSEWKNRGLPRDAAQGLSDASALLAAMADGSIPSRLFGQFLQNPYAVMWPGQTISSQYGDLIPKNVQLDTVRLVPALDGCGGMDAIGKKTDGSLWSTVESSRCPVLKQQDWLIPVPGGSYHLLGADDRVYDVAGELQGMRLLSRDPVLFVTTGRVNMTSPGYRGSIPLPKEFRAVGATMCGQVACFWGANGEVQFSGKSPSIREFSFPIVEGQTVHAVAFHENSERAAIVFRIDVEPKPYYTLVVLDYGRLKFQTSEEHSYISTPVFMPDGTMFVRIDGMLQRFDPRNRDPQFSGAVTGDPVLSSSGAVRASYDGGTWVFRAGLSVRLQYHRPITCASDPFVCIQKSPASFEIAEWKGDFLVTCLSDETGTCTELVAHDPNALSFSSRQEGAPVKVCAFIRESSERSFAHRGTCSTWPDGYGPRLETVRVSGAGFVVVARSEDRSREQVLWSGPEGARRLGSVVDQVVGLEPKDRFPNIVQSFAQDGRRIEHIIARVGG